MGPGTVLANRGNRAPTSWRVIVAALGEERAAPGMMAEAA
jgi:hypothetical protein